MSSYDQTSLQTGGQAAFTCLRQKWIGYFVPWSGLVDYNAGLCFWTSPGFLLTSRCPLCFQWFVIEAGQAFLLLSVMSTGSQRRTQNGVGSWTGKNGWGSRAICRLKRTHITFDCVNYLESIQMTPRTLSHGKVLRWQICRHSGLSLF